MSGKYEDAVAEHYGSKGLLGRIEDGLRQSGIDPASATPDDLAPVDEFHTAGKQMTVKALGMMRLAPGMHLLDAGCGIGGTSRRLAADHGCEVTGIDLTPDYVEVAEALSKRMGLGDRCRFHCASVTDMPLGDATCDGAVSFHVAMNVEDRTGFYAEMRRVLKPGAEFCIFDVMKGPVPDMLYPVPWAATDETSFLCSTDETAGLLEAAGFQIMAEENQREAALAFFEKAFAKAGNAGAPPPLGLHLLTGADTKAKFANYVTALTAHQIEPVIMLAKRT